MISLILRGKQIFDKFTDDEMTVYAAQASFFIIISAIPFIMLLLTLIQIIPAVTQSDLMRLILSIVPDQSKSMVFQIMNDIYTNSPGAITAITAITALWSASRGMLSIERGLNRVNGTQEVRNYIVTRLICSGYTVVFMVICVLTLTFLVLGTSIQNFINRTFPLIAEITNILIGSRTLLSLGILTVWFTCLYTYVPIKKLSWKAQLPGAFFSTVCWIGFSFVFSIYFEHFSNFPKMYGSLTAIVLIMLWMYVCICILFLGAEINRFYAKRRRIETSL